LKSHPRGITILLSGHILQVTGDEEKSWDGVRKEAGVLKPGVVFEIA